MDFDFSDKSDEWLKEFAQKAQDTLAKRSAKSTSEKDELLHKLGLMEELESIEKEIKELRGTTIKSTATITFETKCRIDSEPGEDLLEVLSEYMPVPEIIAGEILPYTVKASTKSVKNIDARVALGRAFSNFIDDEEDGLKASIPDAYKQLTDIAKRAIKFYEKAEKHDLVSHIRQLREQRKK